jgi:hypothetical protein
MADEIVKVPAAWRSAARRAAPYGKPVLLGALFAGGAILTARLFGPSVADKIGKQGGEGFAEGVAAAQRALDNGRGSRFG